MTKTWTEWITQLFNELATPAFWFGNRYRSSQLQGKNLLPVSLYTYTAKTTWLKLPQVHVSKFLEQMGEFQTQLSSINILSGPSGPVSSFFPGGSISPFVPAHGWVEKGEMFLQWFYLSMCQRSTLPTDLLLADVYSYFHCKLLIYLQNCEAST